MSRRGFARLGLIAAIFAASLAHAGEVTSKESGAKPIPKELAGLRDRWVAAMDEFFVPGFAVVVVRDDEVIYIDTFGYRDLEKRLPVTPETSYYIASATKPFTAMGVMKLVEAGKVGLDDPVKKHLPRFELPDAKQAASITIRDLLSHKAGIDCGPAVFLDAYTGEITDDRYYKLLREHGELAGAPSYSNIHFTLAGRVIEAASGKPWRDYLASAIFEPAGMRTATGYADAMYARADVALPYDLDDAGLSRCKVRKSDSTMHAAGGLGISIQDLGRWLRLNINRGEIDGVRIISEESATAMQTLQSDGAQGSIRVMQGFGLAWSIGPFRPEGPKYLMHSGGYIGTSAHTSFLPERKIGVGVLSNCGAPGGIFAESVVSIDVLDRLIGGEHPDYLEQLRSGMAKRLPELRERAAQEKNPAKVTASGSLTLSPDAYAGTYRSDDFGTAVVERDGDTLRIRFGSLPATMLSCQKDQFRVAAAGGVREGRFETEEGKVRAVVLQVEPGEARFVRSGG
ncbi:MAG: serine hydrolase [Phycisphaerae bacterium]|nr:serine hydrolase [Phycisphaerae bacterium]